MKAIVILLTVMLPMVVALQGLHADEHAALKLKEIKHPLKPMLWKIEGKGLKKPSYLFGTIHISDPRATTLHPAAQKAFDSAAAVYTEVDFSPAKQLAAAKLVLRQDEEELAKLVGEPMVEDIKKELKAINPALDIKPFEQMKLWALAIMLPQLEHQMHGKQPLDIQLWNRAQKADKKTGALETIKGQLGQLDKLTLPEQKELLKLTMDMLKAGRKQQKNPYQEIIDAYLKGDDDSIVRLLVSDSYMGLKISPELNQNFRRLLLYERNKNMANTITKVLSQPDAGSVFFAAGSAHYLGEKTVNHHLKKAGYTVTRITE